VIKLLSVKTRRPDGTREGFRRHYEERHVPLGLGFIERFRWRKYVRNHVVAVRAGRADFDCLTEFWFASRADQDSTRSFAASPAFRVLDEDDARFLDVTRRFSCELEERLVAGERPAFDPPGTRRVAALFRPRSPAPGPSDPDAFARALERGVSGLAEQVRAGPEWITFDRRPAPGAGPGELAAIVSVWSAPGAASPALDWRGGIEPDAVVELDVVETPASALYAAA